MFLHRGQTYPRSTCRLNGFSGGANIDSMASCCRSSRMGYVATAPRNLPFPRFSVETRVSHAPCIYNSLMIDAADGRRHFPPIRENRLRDIRQASARVGCVRTNCIGWPTWPTGYNGYTCRNRINAETLLYYKLPAASSRTCSIHDLYSRKSLVITQCK